MGVSPQQSRPSIQIEPTYAQLCDAAARMILAGAQQAIAARGRFSVALRGGSTPRGVYERLATAPLVAAADWPAWHIFWGDERWVPPRHPQSNYHMACTTLLDHVPVNPAQVHPMVPLGWESGARLAKAARAYEATLVSELDVDKSSDEGLARDSRRPHGLDLVLLGLGGDGHTASLLPGARAVEEKNKWVVATPAPGGSGERELPRLTLTLPALNAAREVIFLVSGAAKSATVAAVLEGVGGPASEQRPQPLPAARVVPADGQLTWLLDEDAAGDLRPITLSPRPAGV